MAAQFRILGPVELRMAGASPALGPPKQRTVLAALLVEAGRLVRTETLMDRVWGEAPPVEARNALYAHIMRLRRILRHAAGTAGQPRLDRANGGYLLRIDPDQIDWHRFCRLVDGARDPQHDDRRRAELLNEAVGLWQGTPLADLSGSWVARFREGCRQRYLDAVLAWAQVELRLANPDPVVATVRDLAAEHPLVEPLVLVLMRALHAAGRDAEALEAYAKLQHRLAEELGADPGTELQQLHRAILRGELAAAPPPAAAAGAAGVVPAQLPADVSGFTGRTGELRQLDTVLAGGQQAAAPIVSVLSGTAGVGKTSLAIHWAHRVRQRFPDGQLYVNLRGFDPGGQSMQPAEAVRGFLDALAVPAQRIPSDPDARAGLYRSRLAGRRMLIVLDNARDADQVRPLLPGSPGCFVLVTSRHQLAGLVATEAAQPVPLAMLTTMEARDLVARRLGPDRTAAEPEALDDIVARCGRLPLALAVVAARAAAHPGFPLAALAGELTSASGSLDALTTAEPATDPRSVFSWSYQQLSAEAARLFRLLGLHPGPELSATAAASLAACPVRRARLLLRELADASLLGEPAPGRYAVHDLLHAYATELVHAHEPEPARRDAVHRLLDHYLATAGKAAVLLHPHRDPIALTPALAGGVAAEVSDHAQALSWFTVEYPVLVAMIGQAARAGFDTHVWQLAWSLTDFLDKRGLWRDWSEIQHTALAAARRSADLSGQAHAHRGLAGAYVRLDLTDEAHEHLGSALRIFGNLGDHAGQATIHRGLSWLSEREGDYAEALHQAQRALDLFRTAGHRAGESRALNAVGWCHALLENYGQALSLLQQAIPLLQELGDVQSQALTWDSLGYAHHHLGHHRQAAACYRHALDLHREVGHRYYEADTLTHLGDSQAAAGNPAGARAAWRTALSILDGLGHPDAEQVRAKLDG